MTDDKTEDAQPTAEDVSDDAEAAVPASAEPRALARRRRAVTASVLAVFVVLVSVSGFLGWRLWQHQQLTEAGQQARDAAVSYAQVLTSIDSDKVDENFDQVLAGATGEFKDMYSESSVRLRQLLIDNKATAHGVVVESAVQSTAKDRVVVLLFVDQSVSNASVPDPRLDRSRIKMTMEKVDGQWRAATVELP
ncbi:Mce protein [Mycobacterium sp. ITM-2016-00316]|uniref:Mce protein n=1 Tax=Mycobacterium sp. ITM-2016-00316 TaxID=2099695 RepID=UPI000CFA70AA|nr:Mce protein [Mycobacterium sp. ITM-2016-00316]WNG84766.1 Mce protein [Mycobacterium sp. ITM-2016-00316]